MIVLNTVNQNCSNQISADNKEHVITYKAATKYFKASVECSDSEIKMRNKSEMIETIIKKDNDFKDAFFVGDTTNDATASNTYNLKFIKAIYGYGKKEDWSSIKAFKQIDCLSQLSKF